MHTRNTARARHAGRARRLQVGPGHVMIQPQANSTTSSHVVHTTRTQLLTGRWTHRCAPLPPPSGTHATHNAPLGATRLHLPTPSQPTRQPHAMCCMHALARLGSKTPIAIHTSLQVQQRSGVPLLLPVIPLVSIPIYDTTQLSTKHTFIPRACPPPSIP